LPTPPKIVRQFTAWSFSRWSEYEECPFRAAAKHIDKNREPQRPATDRGNDVHADAYAWLQGKMKKLQGNLTTFTEEFKALKKKHPLVEQQWAFDVNWKLSSWFDNSKTWFRANVDLLTYNEPQGLVTIDDIKSGKMYENKANMQLETYGLAALLMYPTAKVIEARMWYVDLGKELLVTFQRNDLKRLQTLWKSRVTPMFRDRRFAPRPGPYCNWCHLRKEKGGPCKF
jgi:hypothetical protein